jgi:putative transposase
MEIMVNYSPQPGKATQNTYVERFNRSVRHDWLKLFIIKILEQAQDPAAQWLWHCKRDGLHTVNGGFLPRIKQHDILLDPLKIGGITASSKWEAYSVFQFVQSEILKPLIYPLRVMISH